LSEAGDLTLVTDDVEREAAATATTTERPKSIFVSVVCLNAAAADCSLLIGNSLRRNVIYFNETLRAGMANKWTSFRYPTHVSFLPGSPEAKIAVTGDCAATAYGDRCSADIECSRVNDNFVCSGGDADEEGATCACVIGRTWDGTTRICK
jgi:hypothetical protein